MQEDSNVVYIAKIKGTAYEMGEAYGQLFKDYLPQQFANVATLYPGTIHDLLLDFGVPAYIVAALTEDMKVTIMNLALDINWEIAAPYIPQRYIDEMRGIADGSGVDYMTIRRANMLPELTQAHCTVLGVWVKPRKTELFCTSAHLTGMHMLQSTSTQLLSSTNPPRLVANLSPTSAI